jgi:cell division protein FtsN
MAKDYAKKKKGRKKPGASRGNDSSVSKGMVFFVILLVSGLVALLVYLKWYMPSKGDNKPTTAVSEPKKTMPKTDKKTEPKKDQEEADIPFYKTHEEIINKKVEIPIEDLKLPENANKYVYLMPCGSFRDMSRAEELKAQVALVGYESKINQVDVESGRWYRVELGPYTSKRKAESIRHRLQDNGHNYCKIWPKKIN